MNHYRLLFIGGLLSLSFSLFAEPDSLFAHRLMQKGVEAIYQRDIEQAHRYLKRAAATFERLGLTEDYYRARIANAEAYRWQAMLGHAELEVRQCIRDSKEDLGHPNIVQPDAYLALGNIYHQKGEPEQTKRYFYEALHVAEEIFEQPTPSYINVLLTIGEYEAYLGNTREALNRYQHVLIFQQSLYGEHSPVLPATYARIASTFYALREYNRGLDYAERALFLAQENSQEQDLQLARYHSLLGEAQHMQGDLLAARQHFQKAKSIYEQYSWGAQRQLAIAKMLNNIGNTYQGQEAIRHFESSLNYYQNLQGQKLAQADVINNMAIVYHNLQQPKKSLELFQQALRIKQSKLPAHHPGVAQIHGNLMELYDELKQWKKALFHANAAFSSYSTDYEGKELEADWEVLVPQHHFAFSAGAARIINARARILFRRYQEQGALKDLYLTLSTVRSYRYFEEAMMRVNLEKEDLLDIFREEYATLSTGVAAAEALFRFTSKESFLHEAFAFAEQAKSALLRQSLQSGKALDLGILPEHLAQQESNLQRTIAELEYELLEAKRSSNALHLRDIQEQLFEAERHQEAFIQELEQTYPEYYQLKYQQSLGSIPMIQKNLQAGQLLLEYVWTDSTLFVFEITKSDFDLRSVPVEPQLQEALDDLREILARNIIRTDLQEEVQIYSKQASYLYQKLIAPSVAKYPSAKDLLLVPDRDLSYLPFEVLLQEPAKANDFYQDLNYLLYDFNLSYSYSATLLLENKLMNNQSNNNRMLAMGAAYDLPKELSSNRNIRLQRLREDLHDIPEARREVRVLSERFDGSFKIYEAANELEFKLKANDYGILHLAMHGLLNEREPLLSSLVFTETADSLEDNFLHAYEIANMDLQANLVVLSACETGYGKFQRGEGVMSLARSFMYAGTPSLVVSLWQVNDHATSKLMPYFYENLAKDMPKHEALRQAKLRYLQESSRLTAHPSLWASFIQIGSPSKLAVQQRIDYLTIFSSLGSGLLLIFGLWWRKHEQRKRERRRPKNAGKNRDRIEQS